MIEPRARVVSFEDADFGDMRIQVIKASTAFPELLADGTELTTVADVLAALREPSEAMIASGFAAAQDKGYVLTTNVTAAIFLAMLDQFERDQGSAT
jgi:hypothetical protein